MFTLAWIACLAVKGSMSRDLFFCGLIVAPIVDVITSL